MKIFRRNTENASVMVLGLVTGAILMVGLASYISLIQAQNTAVMRSTTWNTAIPAAEAGIEDALAPSTPSAPNPAPPTATSSTEIFSSCRAN